LLHNEGDGTFADVSVSSGVSETLTSGTWGTAFFDYDNNGYLDLFYVGGNVGNADPVDDFFLVNNSDGTFSDFSAGSGLNDPGRGRSASMADFDGDGFVDLFVGNYGQTPSLFHNDTTTEDNNSNNWMAITLEGTDSNRDAIGARVAITTPNGITQIREITSGPTHGGGDQRVALFGIGHHMSATVEITWPTGVVSNEGSKQGNAYYHFVEESTIVSDIVIDNNFSDWTNGIGNEVCIADERGVKDWTASPRLDITKYCVSTDEVDTLYILLAYDKWQGVGTTLACAFFDTDQVPDGNINAALCVQLLGLAEGRGPLAVQGAQRYSCNNTIRTGCQAAVLQESYPLSSVGFSNNVVGPFGDRDSMVEFGLPFADLGLTQANSLQTTMYSISSSNALSRKKDSIFGTTWQDSNKRLSVDLDNGGLFRFLWVEGDAYSTPNGR
jgi:hypothetical protein